MSNLYAYIVKLGKNITNITKHLGSPHTCNTRLAKYKHSIYILAGIGKR